MLDKFIKHYFIDLRVFPFEAKDIFGAEPAKANVFMVWEHYYKKALQKKLLKEARLENSQSGKFDVADEEGFQSAFDSHFKPED